MPDHIDMGDNDYRKENLKMEHLKLEITRDINNSNLAIGNVYYILKTIFNDIEGLYNQQVQKEYQEFCDIANAEAVQRLNDQGQSEEQPAAVDENIEEKEEN